VKINPKVTQKRVIAAVKRAQSGLDNPGFCIACGKEAEGCEPDARNYRCEYCEANEVFGAEELMMMIF